MGTAAKTFPSTIKKNKKNFLDRTSCKTNMFLHLFLFSIIYIPVGIAQKPIEEPVLSSHSIQQIKNSIFSNDNEEANKPFKFILYGHIVIKQEQNDTETPTPQKKHHKPIITPQTQKTHTPSVKTISKNFKFTENHKRTLKNVYINLDYQTECNNFNHIQCWISKLEFEDGEIIDDVHVKVDGIVTPECKLMLCQKCIQKYGINGYKMLCEHQKHNPYLYFFTPDRNSNAWLMPQNGVFFLLEKGNYHSAWQEGSFLGEINRQSVKAAQNVIKKFNYCEHFPQDELFLVFTQIYEVKDRTNAIWFSRKSVSVLGGKINLPIHAFIHSAPNHNPETHLHERIHEYINNINNNDIRQIKYDNKWVYTGEKTVSLVREDAKNNPTLYSNIIFLPNLGKYGLIMQDHGHLGDWGTEASPSSYNHVNFKIGKYTMSVINEAGYYMT